jgi:predicted NACHT family NTPase
MIEATPIYISLKEWSDSQKKLLNYIEEKFEICGFPDAIKMIESILDSGKALVLLDGLDEMNHDEIQQKKLLQEITNFTEQYHKSHFCLTCRIAANDFSFDRFTYVEIADFNEMQQGQFIGKWFSLEPIKLSQFNEQWSKPENNKIHDLARTPLLLTLICLSFGETLQFPKRRVDLYSEAVDALLKKWDSSRAIIRGDIYKQLELTRKKQLLSFVAYNTFVREEYLIRTDVIADEIKQFIRKLPHWDKQIEVDAELILRGIESHHGLLVERARNIYSFSHLTIHEYFTALYILDNVANDTLSTLVDNLVTSIRWREVMLMCSSSQGNATQLLTKFAWKIWETVSDDKDIVKLLKTIQATRNVGWLEKAKIISPTLNEHSNATSYERALEVAANLSLLHDAETSHTIIRARKLVKELGYNEELRLDIKVEHKFNRYLSLTSLFIECLQISSVDNRADLEGMALMDFTRIQ